MGVITGSLGCGCHINGGRIVFCSHHENTGKMMSLLDSMRRYFIETTAKESPFVKRVDSMVPRVKGD